MPDASRRRVELTNGLGLHLRPAALIVRLTQQFKAKVRVECNGRQADGRSMLDLMLLAAEGGAYLELEARGPDAPEAITALSALIEARFRESEEPINPPAR